MTITAERDEEIDFSEPYFVAKGRILVKKDNTDIKGVDDLAGKNVCTALGSTYEETLKKQAPKAKLRLVDSYSECLELIQNGGVDAVSTDDVILTGMIIQDDTLKLVGDELTTEPYGAGIKEGDTAFKEFVDAVIAKYKDGRQLGDGLREVGRPVHRREAGAADDDAAGGARPQQVSDLLNVLTEHIDEFGGGLWVTVRLVVASFAIALVVGTLVAALRIAPSTMAAASRRDLRRDVSQHPAARPADDRLRRAAAGRRADRPVDGGDRVARAVHRGVRRRGAALRRLRGEHAGRSRRRCRSASATRETLRRIVLPQAFRTVIPPLGSITIAMIKNSAIVGASIIALDDILKNARIVQAQTFKIEESFFWAAVGYLLLTVTATIAFRDARATPRDQALSGMGYLFDPDNWEWLVTGHNARFILEGFLVNLQIALIAMVFSLIVGLGLALLRLSRVRVRSAPRPACGSTCGATCR